MRVSGNIFDRLLIRIFPLFIVGGLPFYLMAINSSEFFKGFLSALLILWAFDSILILSKKGKSVKIDGGTLSIGSDRILSRDILTIAPKRDPRKGLSIRSIEIEYLKDGIVKKQRVINKPGFWDFLSFSTRFKTIKLLTTTFPELEAVVLPEGIDA